MKYFNYFFKTAIIIICVISLFGCHTTGYYQRASSGKIGCLPDDIEISNLKDYTWRATCKGKSFICNFVDVGNYQGVLYCTPEIK